jgi:uncharacterized protein (TIGR02145 family)
MPQALFLLLLAFPLFIACEDKPKTADSLPENGGENVFTDTRDGQKYKTARIGDHIWMAENLNYKTGNSWCNDNDESNCKKYGRLYDWNTAKEACPQGWHLADSEEWDDLIEAAGGRDIAGQKLKSKSDWIDNIGNPKGSGTDELGFSALPGEYRSCFDGVVDNKFQPPGSNGYWWSATAYEYNNKAYDIRLSYYEDYVSVRDSEKCYNLSVRCVSDKPEIDKASKDALTDPRDGNTYRTVNIGRQRWMAENLNFKADSSSCDNNDESNCKKYGRLYNWEAAIKACPAGWHLSSREEWNRLVQTAGGSEAAGKKLKSKTGWRTSLTYDENKERIKSADDYGFSAKPSGYGIYGYWWSAIEYKANNAFHRYMRSDFNFAYENVQEKSFRYSVRCVSDEPVAEAEDKKTVVIEKSTEPCNEDKRNAIANEEKDIVDILLPSFYGLFDECDLNPAKKINNSWVSLYKDSTESYYIKQADYYIGDGFDDCNGVSTKDLRSKDDVVLFMNLPHIKKGKIDHVKISQKGILPNDTMRFEFNGISYYFRATGGIVDTISRNIGDYKLYVGTNGKPEELLLDIGLFEDSFMQLLFIGDIDGDGIPDFIFDTSNHYEFTGVALFLSTKAEKGKITKKVAALGIGHAC